MVLLVIEFFSALNSFNNNFLHNNKCFPFFSPVLNRKDIDTLILYLALENEKHLFLMILVVEESYVVHVIDLKLSSGLVGIFLSKYQVQPPKK